MALKFCEISIKVIILKFSLKVVIIRNVLVCLLYVTTNVKNSVIVFFELKIRILKKEAIYPTAAGYLTLQLAIILSVSTYTLFPVGKNNENKPLPVFAWYPHYMNDGTPYKVTYFLQAMSIFTAGSLWVCVDTVNFGLLAHHNVMFKILSRRITSLGWTNKFRSDYNECNYGKLCEHVKYFGEISRYGSETNEIYGSSLFAKISLSVIIICSFVYSLSLEITNYAGFIAQVAILGVIVSTLFVQSWMSEQICAASLGLLNKAVESNFVDMDARTTKALLVFMTGLSNTTYIEVGTILKVRVNLKMFVTIIDFAYKCLALLKTAV